MFLFCFLKLYCAEIFTYKWELMLCSSSVPAVGAGVKYEYIWTSTQCAQYAILRLWNRLQYVQENSDGPLLPPISDTYVLVQS